MRSYLALGYDVVKIKIGGADLAADLERIEVVRELGWSPRRCIPHGGQQFALGIAAGLGLGGNESYPYVFRPFGGFADSTPVKGEPRGPARGAGDRL